LIGAKKNDPSIWQAGDGHGIQQYIHQTGTEYFPWIQSIIDSALFIQESVRIELVEM